MKRRKIAQLLAIALTAISITVTQPASAQGTRGGQYKTPDERAQLLTEWMKTKLGLDSIQATQAQAINLAYSLKNEPILKSDAGKLARFKKLKALQKQKDRELKNIFSIEQFKQYESLQEEMKEKMKEKRQ